MQTHPKDPIVLWHAELPMSQLCFPVLHSFMSGNQDLMLNYQTESVLFQFYIYWMRDSNAMLSRLVASPRMNKSVFKIRQLQGTLIQLMALITTVKWQIKSVKMIEQSFTCCKLCYLWRIIPLRIRNNYFDGTKYHRTWVLARGTSSY